MLKLRIAGLAGIVGFTALIAVGIHLQWQSARSLAQEGFVRDARSETRTAAVVLERPFRSIYENLRTLSSLPGVRALNRHGENLTPETRVTIQQMYNNLAASVSVSEVYFTPIAFDAGRFDPITGRNEEPIIMFDELIFNAGLNMSSAERFNAPEKVKSAESTGPEEIEKFEYAQLMDHAAWFKAHRPALGSGGTLDVPIIAGPEVVTCDNTLFISSRADADRSGVIFSVPFYGADGKIRGLVSAIILTRAIQGLIHDSKYALVNTGNGYVVAAAASTIPQQSLQHVAEGKPDPTLIYSEALTFGVKDARSPWMLWAGVPNSSFKSSKNVELADKTRRTNYLLLGLLSAAAVAGLLLSDRLIRQSRALADAARIRESEAQDTASHLQGLNDDISRLNMELSDKIRQLGTAQTEIINKGRMAQLGQVVAMVSHEIRNPLGGVRTSTFLLRRKLQPQQFEFDTILDRIDAGIRRCDSIITQLLDFSRTSKPVVEQIDLDDWLANAMNEEATALPDTVTITCNLGLGGQKIAFDPDRLRRAVANLVSNACEAMMDSNRVLVKFAGSVPHITLTTRLTQRGAEIDVEDNGPGIPSDVMAHIREPLFTTKSFGTGLGVPAVEKIAELHGGGLEIVSQPGRGSRFTLWLPLTQKAGPDASAA